MKTALFQKKESEKEAETVSSQTIDSHADMQKESGTGAGMPLFLQRASFYSSSSTSPIQRRLDEDEDAGAAGQPDNALAKPETIEEETEPPASIQERQVDSKSLADIDEKDELSAGSQKTVSIQRQVDEKEPPAVPTNDNEPIIQARLTIGKPNDEYEQEADQVADTVVRMSDRTENRSFVDDEETEGQQSRPVRTGAPTQDSLQREISDNEEKPLPAETEDTDVQTKTVPGKRSGTSAPLASRQIKNLVASSTGGHSLASQVREKVEPVLGGDLSQVRVFDDSRANRAAASINAKAFTHQNKIFLGRNQSANDISLIAHEATHTRQQGAVPLRAKTSIQRIQRTKSPLIQPDLRSLAGKAWRATGGRAVSYIGGKARAVYRWGKKKIIGIIERYAPGLLSLLRGGVIGLIKKKVMAGIDQLSGGLFSSLRKKGLAGVLKGAFGRITGGVTSALGAMAKGGCDAILSAVQVVVEFAKALGGPVFRFIGSVAARVGGFFKRIWSDFAAPALKAIKRVAGSAWNWIKRKAQWIWKKTAPIRDTFGRAWRWLKKKFNLAWGAAGDILGWFKAKATAVWNKIKGFIKPILGPLKVIGGLLVLLSPLGPIIAIWKGAPLLWKAIKWLWNNWGRDLLVKSRYVLKKKILPALRSGLSWLKSAVKSAITWMKAKLAAIAAAFANLVKALGGSSLLSVLSSAVSWVAGQFQRLAGWVTSTFIAAAQSIRDVVTQIHNFLRPFYGLIAAIVLFPVYPWMLPIVVAGWAWRLLPDCFKEPIINFAIDVMTAVMRALPDFRNFGEAWAQAKEKLVDGLKQARAMNRERKLEIANRIAKMMTGEDIAWIGNLISAARQMPQHFLGSIQEALIGMNLNQPLPFERKAPLTGKQRISAASSAALAELGVLGKGRLSKDDVSVDAVASTTWDPKFVQSLDLDVGGEKEFGERADESLSVEAMREEALTGGRADSSEEELTKGAVAVTEEDTEKQLQALMNQPAQETCVKKAPAESAKSGEIPEHMKIGPLTRAQRGRYMMHQMWKGIKKWFSCNWKWLVPTLIVAIIALIALEILTGGAITAALPAIAQILGTVFVGVAMVQVAKYLGEYLAKAIAGDVIGAAKSLAMGLAVGAVELVFALLFNLSAVLKAMKAGLKASVKAAAGAAKRTVTGTIAAVKQLRGTVTKGARTAAKNIRVLSGAVLREGKLIMKGVGSGIGRGVRSLDDLARKLWKRVRFKKFKIRRVGRLRIQLWGFINPWLLMADGSVEYVKEADVAGHHVGDLVNYGVKKGRIVGWVGDVVDDASQLVKQLRHSDPKDAARVFELIEQTPNPKRFIREVLSVHGPDEISKTLRAFDEIAGIPGAQKLMRDLTAVGRRGRKSAGAIGEIQYAAKLRKNGVGIKRIGDIDEAGREAADIVLDNGKIIDVKHYDWTKPSYRNADGTWNDSMIEWIINDRIDQIIRYRKLYSEIGKKGTDVPIRFAFKGPISDIPPKIISRLRKYKNVEVVGF